MAFEFTEAATAVDEHSVNEEQLRFELPGTEPDPDTGDITWIADELAIQRIVQGGMPEVKFRNDELSQQFARTVERHEVVRDADQAGDISREYAIGQIAARGIFVDGLYSSQCRGSFVYHIFNLLKEAHFVAVDYHEFAGRSFTYGSHDAVHGDTKNQVRSEIYAIGHDRLEDAQIAQAVARLARDPYRFRFDPAYDGRVMSPQLRGIPENMLPKDTYYTTKDGEGIYDFDYPRGNYMLETYLRAVDNLNALIIGQWEDNPVAYGEPRTTVPRKALFMVAEQYQLLACLRPFSQVNNSLFANLANTHLKTFGFRGISHDHLDILAQRLQPDTFKRHFVRRVLAQQESVA